MSHSVLMKKENGTRIMPKVYRLYFKNNSVHYVLSDRNIFIGWADGKISTEKACELLSANLGSVVNRNQFLANAEWLGYRRNDDE